VAITTARPVSWRPSASCDSGGAAATAVVLDEDRGDLGRQLEADPDRLEALAHRGQDLGQPIRADVRAGVDQDVGRRAVQREDLDHVADVAALVGPGVELAVGVGAGAALAEAVVAVGIDAAVLGQALQVPAPRLHQLAAIDDDRGDPGARELVRAVQTRRTGADDDHRGAGDRDRVGRAQGRRRVGPGADRQVKPHPAVARVDGAAADLEERELRRLDRQLVGHRGPDLGGVGLEAGRVERQVELELEVVVPARRLGRGHRPASCHGAGRRGPGVVDDRPAVTPRRAGAARGWRGRGRGGRADRGRWRSAA
jgi:hypothetical protein